MLSAFLKRLFAQEQNKNLCQMRFIYLLIQFLDKDVSWKCHKQSVLIFLAMFDKSSDEKWKYHACRMVVNLMGSKLSLYSFNY